MTAADIINHVRISDVAEALCVPVDRTRRRGVASWRKGRNFSVSFDDNKNVWHDFATGEGGGVVAFVERVRGCDRKTALRWLADFAGVPLREQSEAERRQYAKACESAPFLAQRLADFAYGLRLLTERRYERASALATAVLELGIDPVPHVEAYYDVSAVHEATPSQIAKVWRELQGRDRTAADRIERVGREDRQHAEHVTASVISFLCAAAQEAA